MSNTETSQEKVLGGIFFPFATAAQARVQSQGGRFVYYTTAAAALKILRNREIWMRNTMTMNDVREVDHGLDCLMEAYNSNVGRELEAVLDNCFQGMSTEIKSQFNAWIPGIRYDTFVTCLSEHYSNEDRHGRLSMWRAYGGSSGVAIVINGAAMFGTSRALAAYSSPVAYLDSNGVADELKAITQRIRQNQEFVKGIGRERTKNILFHALRFSAVCTKHPAFQEEKEWRVVASPSIESSDLVPKEIEDVYGVPQLVLKIKLEDHLDRGLRGLEPRDLIDRVLIGPCDHPDVVCRAFRETLTALGVPDAGNRAYGTGVPLRTRRP